MALSGGLRGHVARGWLSNSGIEKSNERKRKTEEEEKCRGNLKLKGDLSNLRGFACHFRMINYRYLIRVVSMDLCYLSPNLGLLSKSE